MKTTLLITAWSLFASFICLDTTKNNYVIKTVEELIARYEGRENQMFKFVDENKVELYFDEVSEIVEVNLFDDKSVGKEFLLSWEEEVIDVYDDEGKSTGETQTIRTITKIKEIKK